jgi:hypothetical protein
MKKLRHVAYARGVELHVRDVSVHLIVTDHIIDYRKQEGWVIVF